MACIGLLLLISSTSSFIQYVKGHGYMIDPPQRSSMWRFGYETPINWSDDELNCGGFGTQWNLNDGNCGECGDPFNLPRPRPNEDGGKYGKGVIVREYKAGDVINVTVTLLTSHQGYFQFRLCPINREPEEQSCFDENVLELADGSGNKYHLPKQDAEDNITIEVKLPEELICDQCVLQWHYRTGNNWGTCEDGTEAVGCGPQETYQNCADVTIS